MWWRLGQAVRQAVIEPALHALPGAQRLSDAIAGGCAAASHLPWPWQVARCSTSPAIQQQLKHAAADQGTITVGEQHQHQHQQRRSKRRKARPRGDATPRPAAGSSPTAAAALSPQQLHSSLTSALLQLQQMGVSTALHGVSTAAPGTEATTSSQQPLLLRVAAQVAPQVHQQHQHQHQQQRVHLEPVIRRPPPTTRARAHCIGLEMDVGKVKEQFVHALLHSSNDFAVFSTHGLLQHANYYRTMYGRAHRPAADQQPHPHPQHPHPPQQHHPNHDGHDEQVTRPMPLCECVVVYEFGAAVFFSSFAGAGQLPPQPSQQHAEPPQGGNGGPSGGAGASGVPPPGVLDRQQQDELEQLCLEVLKPFVIKTPPEGTQLPPPEEVRLAVSSGIRKELQKGGELLQLKRWDQGSVEAISRIMGQSVALDMHTDITDEKLYQLEQLMQQLVQEYRAPRHRRLLARIMALPPWLLSGHTAAGSSAAYINQEAQLVESSALTIMVINRLGILDKDHTPWESEQHDELWQRLRSFFTIDKRLSHLLRKLEQLEQKTDHLISLKTDERTMSVELLICGLIFTEIVLNVQLGAHNHPPLPPPV